MVKFIFILFTFSIVLFGENNCKTDIYFANGILTRKEDAIRNSDLLKKTILAEIYNNDTKAFNSVVGEVGYAYNHTEKEALDLLESLKQKLSTMPILEYAFISNMLNKIFGVPAHDEDLKEQIKTYKKSIESGHQVLVVAHSQGNLFTYEAYRGLPSWMRNNFEAISIASPGHYEIKHDTPRISWDNDIVAHLGLYSGLVKNPVRQFKMYRRQPNPHVKGPFYVQKNNINTLKNRYNNYAATDSEHDSNVHAFTFYMGKKLRKDGKSIIYDAIDKKSLSTNIARDKIIKHIKDKLPEIDDNNTSENIKPKTGDVEVNLEWRSGSCRQSKLINLDLETDWDKGEIDVKDNGLTYEHFVIESQRDIYPGTFSFFARDRSDQAKLDSHEMYVNPVDIFVDVKTPGNVNMRYKAQAKTPEQLNIGKLFEIIIDYKKIKSIPSDSIKKVEHLPSEYRDFVNNFVNNCEGDESCGCIPCEYKATSALQEVKLGPLSGASLTISEAYNPSKIVYIGKTTEGRDIYTTGIIDIPYEEYSKFDDDKLYIIKAQGGLDIDSNDDFIVDDNPVQNGGTLYTIVSGYEMKHLAIKVNILSNIAYHVSKDLLNDKSKKDELIARLDDVAKRVLKRKVFPIQGDYNIKYTDILSWLPTIDKSLLFKDYDKNVHPIVEMVYKDEDVTTQSYDFVYKSLEKGAPEIYGFGAKVSINAPANSIVGMLDIKSNGSSDIKSMILSGDGKENFKIDTKGILRVLDETNFDGNGTIYKLEVVAINEDGKKSLPASVVVEVLDLPNIPYLKEIAINDLAENSQLKDVGRVVFKDKESVITDIVLKGNGSEDFTIDNDGYIRVKDNVNIDYERRQTYSLKAIATNAQGNDSVPVAININVIDDIDTPFLQLVLLAHVDENVDVGTKIANVQTVKDGKSEITGYSIVGTTSMPINIDDNGTLYVDGFINFEEREEYNFMVVAHSKFGDSNRVLTTVVVNDIAEYIVPLLKDFNGTVKEDAKYGDIVGQISIEQGEMPIQSMTLKGIGAENFTINNDGVIKVSQNAFFDFHILTKYNLEVYANTKSGSSSKSKVVIEVEDVKNLPPKVSNTLFSVSEDVNIGSVVGKIRHETGDANITDYSISGKRNEDFSINKNGEIIVKNMLDYSIQNRYEFDITLSNRFGKSNSATIVINVEKSLIARLEFDINTPENTSNNNLIGKVDINSSNQIKSISLSGEGSEKFKIETNGSIYLVDALDYEDKRNYHLEVAIIDVNNKIQKADLVIHVTNIAEIVPMVSEFKGYIEDNATNDSIVGHIKLLSSGDSEIISYSISGEGSEYFYVDSGGVVRLKDSTNLDENVKKVYNISIQTTNKAGTSQAVSGTIILTYDTQIPPLPSNLRLTGVFHDSIEIKWDDMENERGFYIYINNIKYATLDKDVLAYAINNLAVETKYLFGVSSFNNRGESKIAYIEGVTDINRIELFKNVLKDRCGISETVINENFNQVEKHYNQNIFCFNSGLTDKELLSFKAIKIIHGYLYIAQNYLTNVDGLTNLQKVGGNLDIYNNQLVNIDGLNNLVTVEGSLYLNKNYLTNVDGLRGLKTIIYNLDLRNNDLTNVDGLINLSYVGGYVNIYKNLNLKDISGLSNIKATNKKPLYIALNQYITKVDKDKDFCKATWDLKDINGDIVDNMSEVCEGFDVIFAKNEFKKFLNKRCNVSLDQFENNFNIQQKEYNLDIDCSNKGLKTEDLGSFVILSSIKGNLYLNDNNLTNVNILYNLTNVDGNLNLSNNALKNINGLTNLKTIGKTLDLSNNELTNINGLYALQSVQDINLSKNVNLQSIYGMSNIEPPTLSRDRSLILPHESYKFKLDTNSKTCQASFVWQIFVNQVQKDTSIMCSVDDESVDKFENIVVNKCKYENLFSISKLDNGVYPNDINCTNSDLNDEDILSFMILKGVNRLDLSDNNLTHVDSLLNLRNIKELVLHNNSIQNVDGLLNIKSFEKLDLSKNSLISIEGLKYIKNGVLDITLNPNLSIDMEFDNNVTVYK